jgi:hypothetical protein
MPKRSGRSTRSVAPQPPGCAVFLTADARAQRFHGPLWRLAALLDWSALRDLLAPLIAEAAGRHGGPEGHDPLALTGAMLLGRWYGLGERALADALARRWDFQLFCGFAPDLPTPSGSTLRRHEQRLRDAELLDVVLAEVDAVLASAGLEVRPVDGALVDVALRPRKTMEDMHDER